MHEKLKGLSQFVNEITQEKDCVKFTFNNQLNIAIQAAQHVTSSTCPDSAVLLLCGSINDQVTSLLDVSKNVRLKSVSRWRHPLHGRDGIPVCLTHECYTSLTLNSLRTVGHNILGWDYQIQNVKSKLNSTHLHIRLSQNKQHIKERIIKGVTTRTNHDLYNSPEHVLFIIDYRALSNDKIIALLITFWESDSAPLQNEQYADLIFKGRRELIFLIWSNYSRVMMREDSTC